MDWITNPDIWTSFLTLCALEIVLGIDNLIFISILSEKLPVNQQSKARRLGLLLALLMRVALLFSISWLMGLTANLFTVCEIGVSGRDLILLIGGLFLIYKSVKELHEKMEDAEEETKESNSKVATFGNVILQIMLLDIVFSLDSVITAVGMAEHIEVMIAAVVVSLIIMILAADKLSSFVNNNPTIKVLALAFLLMIGTALIAEGVDFHIPKGYIYFSMAFAVLVELFNIRVGTRKRKPVA